MSKGEMMQFALWGGWLRLVVTNERLPRWFRRRGFPDGLGLLNVCLLFG